MIIQTVEEFVMSHQDLNSSALAATSVGVGLKHEHVDDVLSGPHAVDFFEVHAENYIGDGGRPHYMLGQVRARYPLSLHGVGLSIGAGRDFDRAHLARLRRLVDRYQPCWFSEHLAWSTHGDRFLNDLLPLPYPKKPWHRSAIISTWSSRCFSGACCWKILPPMWLSRPPP
jgi:uncharacterized protein